MSDISSKFKEPFSLNDLEWRVQISVFSAPSSLLIH